MLEVTDLHQVFMAGTPMAKTALKGLSLHLSSGDFVSVVGSNGAGKSTLLNAIAGSLLIQQGQIRIAGQDVSYLPEHKRSSIVSRVFQNPLQGTAPSLSVEENLALAAERGQRRGLGTLLKPTTRQRLQAELKSLQLGLENRLTTKVSLLSGGQRQALTLLMATMVRPKLLLLDEHIAALDPATASRVVELTQQVVQQQKLTTLMVTHNLEQAIKLGNRLIMMHEGEIILDIKGKQKSTLTIELLRREFEKARGMSFNYDRAVLA